jgi:rRNA-processing protein FCF1
MKTILLDTNFLLIPGTLGIDIFREIDRIADFRHKICIIDRTVDELHRIIEEQSGAHKAAAELGLKLLEKEGVKPLKTETIKNVDELILKTANKEDFIVATQDRALKAKLRSKRVPLMILRQKKYLKIMQN